MTSGIRNALSLSLSLFLDEEEIRSRRGRLLFRGWNDDLGLGFIAAIRAERYPLRGNVTYDYDRTFSAASFSSQTKLSPLKTYHSRGIED